ncbi:hypothetical protein MF265_22270 [Serratia marcescens]|uniref:hypothetical protein n=1 Tax=Serratia marcescens TaxID=615 RepID=UPI001EF0E76B|nr:hypothetical protein [Serratia marcescens]ULH10612.1 hypothetical protein MF265_22270 [Serratia marcescens]
MSPQFIRASANSLKTLQTPNLAAGQTWHNSLRVHLAAYLQLADNSLKTFQSPNSGSALTGRNSLMRLGCAGMEQLANPLIQFIYNGSLESGNSLIGLNSGEMPKSAKHSESPSLTKHEQYSGSPEHQHCLGLPPLVIDTMTSGKLNELRNIYLKVSMKFAP